MTLFRYLLVVVGVMMFLPFAIAQPVKPERVWIETRRVQLEAGFSSDDASCHQRFAVNNCLIEVNAKRREAMADLRRQEILLNDEERKARGAEQIRKLEEKRSADNRQEATNRRAQILLEYDARTKRDHESKAATAEKSKVVHRLSDSGIRKVAPITRPSTTGHPTVGVGKTDQYPDRQSQTRKRYIRHEAQASKRPPSTAKPLPVPP